MPRNRQVVAPPDEAAGAASRGASRAATSPWRLFLSVAALLCAASLLVSGLLAEQRLFLGMSLSAPFTGGEDGGAGAAAFLEPGGSSRARRGKQQAPPTFPLLALQRCLRCNLIGVPGACGTVGPDEIVVLGKAAWEAVAASFYVPAASGGAADGPHFDTPPAYEDIPSGALVSGIFRVFKAPSVAPPPEQWSWSSLQVSPAAYQRVGDKASGWYPLVHADQAWIADLAPPGALSEGADDRDVLALLKELTGLGPAGDGSSGGQGSGGRQLADDSQAADEGANAAAPRGLASKDEDDPEAVYAPPPYDLRPEYARIYHAMCGSRGIVCGAGDEACLLLGAGARVALYQVPGAASSSVTALATRYSVRPLSDLVIAPGSLAGYTRGVRTGRAVPHAPTVLRGFDAWVEDNVLELPVSGQPPLPVFRIPRRTVQFMWEPGRAVTCRVDMPVGGNLGDTFGAHVLPHLLPDVRAALCPSVHLVQSAMRVALQVRQERAARLKHGKHGEQDTEIEDLMDPSVVNFYLLLGSLVDFTLPVRGAVIAGAGMRGVDLVDSQGRQLPRHAIYPVENAGGDGGEGGDGVGVARVRRGRRLTSIDAAPLQLTGPVVLTPQEAGAGEDALRPEEWDPHSPSIFPVLRAWVLGVRGPRSRDVLLGRYGLNPAVVGDPGVLAPDIFPRTRAPPEQQHPVCFLLHYSDAEAFGKTAPQLNPVFPMAGGDKTLIQLFDLLANCARVASSSLHGVIFAHAFGIPALAFKMPTSSEDDFKYVDYYHSVGVYSFGGRAVPSSFSQPGWGTTDSWAADVDAEPQPADLPLDTFRTRRFYAAFETDKFW